MESSATQPRYEFTTLRIVLLVIAAVLWFLIAFGSAARETDDSGGSFVGYLLGALLFSLFISWVVRSLFRLVRRRPVIQPAWTPGLFAGALLIEFLSAVGNSAPS